jgi:hypothetical protein
MTWGSEQDSEIAEFLMEDHPSVRKLYEMLLFNKRPLGGQPKVKGSPPFFDAFDKNRPKKTPKPTPKPKPKKGVHVGTASI